MKHIPIVEHVRAAHLHIGEILGLLLDALTQHYVNNFWLGLFLKVEICVGLLFLQVLTPFDHVLVATQRVVPLSRLLVEELVRVLLEMIFKLVVVASEILIADP